MALKKAQAADRRRAAQNVAPGVPLRLIDPLHARIGKQTFLYFGGCDYLRLSWDPRLRGALLRGAQRWGMSVAASRRTTGNRRLYEELEESLAAFFQVESAVLVASGYQSDLAVAQGLSGYFSQAFIDERAHVALMDATHFLMCPVECYKHRSPEDLSRLLAMVPGAARVLVATDGVFAFDGSTAPLRRYRKLLPRNGWLLVDDAHGVGVLGKQGRGTAEVEGVEDARLIRTMTLSKAFGSYGGAILCASHLRSMIVERSRIYAGSTALPPPLAQAALEAVHLMRKRPGLRRRLQHNGESLRRWLRRGGVELPQSDSPTLIIRSRRGGRDEVIDTALEKCEILPPFMNYGGDQSGGYYRFAISSAHRKEHLRVLADALLSCQNHWQV